MAARSFAKGFLAELHSSVVDNLRDAGFFYDPLEAEVSNTFLPWLLEEMDGTLEKQRIARELADQLVAAAGMRHAAAAAEASKLKAEIEAAKAKRRRRRPPRPPPPPPTSCSRSTRRSRRFSRGGRRRQRLVGQKRGEGEVGRGSGDAGTAGGGGPRASRCGATHVVHRRDADEDGDGKMALEELKAERSLRRRRRRRPRSRPPKERRIWRWSNTISKCLT